MPPVSFEPSTARPSSSSGRAGPRDRDDFFLNGGTVPGSGPSTGPGGSRPDSSGAQVAARSVPGPHPIPSPGPIPASCILRWDRTSRSSSRTRRRLERRVGALLHGRAKRAADPLRITGGTAAARAPPTSPPPPRTPVPASLTSVVRSAAVPSLPPVAGRRERRAESASGTPSTDRLRSDSTSSADAYPYPLRGDFRSTLALAGAPEYPGLRRRRGRVGGPPPVGVRVRSRPPRRRLHGHDAVSDRRSAPRSVVASISHTAERVSRRRPRPRPVPRGPPLAPPCPSRSSTVRHVRGCVSPPQPVSSPRPTTRARQRVSERIAPARDAGAAGRDALDRPLRRSPSSSAPSSSAPSSSYSSSAPSSSAPGAGEARRGPPGRGAARSIAAPHPRDTNRRTVRRRRAESRGRRESASSRRYRRRRPDRTRTRR